MFLPYPADHATFDIRVGAARSSKRREIDFLMEQDVQRSNRKERLTGTPFSELICNQCY